METILAIRDGMQKYQSRGPYGQNRKIAGRQVSPNIAYAHMQRNYAKEFGYDVVAETVLLTERRHSLLEIAVKTTSASLAYNASHSDAENWLRQALHVGRLGEIIRPAAIPGSPDLSGLADREIGRKESKLYT
jgi:hypothetical protein